MWTPNQRLTEDTLRTLREAGFSPLKLEFLGWLSYYAAALNNSRNPTKAAHTILASDNAVKMLKVFQERKKESVRPKERPDHDKVDQEFERLQKWIEQVEEDAGIVEEPLM